MVTPAVLAELAPPVPEGTAHKGKRGCVLVVGGTTETPGAVLLAGIAALRAGAGVLQVATVASVSGQLAVAMPEARVIGLPETSGGDIAGHCGPDLLDLAGGADAILLGPGMADESALAELVPGLLEGVEDARVVLDAKALSAISPQMALSRRDRLVLTPNTSEGARLLGLDVTDVEHDPHSAHRRLVEMYVCTVALRGGETWTGEPGGPAYHDTSGSAGLGSSGSGDVLAGFLAGLLARGAAPVAAAVWAVHVHALSGRRLGTRIGPLGYLARELLDELASVAAELSP